MQPATKIDPIRTNYFDVIETVDDVSKLLFISAAVLSVAAALVQENDHKVIFQWIQILFLTLVVVLFALDQWVKLYLSPRAADARAQDFLSHAYDQPLSAQRTAGYYNNADAVGIRRLAAQTFENTLFTKEICREMLKREAPLALFYLLVWVVALAHRDTPITVLGTLAQVIFGEQIVARLLRLFWLQRRCEQLHEDLRRLYLSAATAERFDGPAMDSYTRYEVSKATAGITLSSKVFERLNPKLSAQWVELRKVHGIA
jgi:hypothetical protein